MSNLKRFEPSPEMEALRGWLADAPEGAYVTYVEAEKATGVRMDTRGKQLLRSALRSLDREYRVERGVGIELDSPENTLPIITRRFRAVSNSSKRAAKTTRILYDRHHEKLPEEDRHKVTFAASVLSTMLAMSRALSARYRTQARIPEATNLSAGNRPVFKTKN